MSTVSYNGKAIEPAPLYSVQKVYDKGGDGQIIGSRFTITLRGTIVSNRGSPNTSQEFQTGSSSLADETIDANDRLNAIQLKKEAIRQLFSEDGRTLEVQAASGAAPLKCNPRVQSIQFEDGIYFFTADYVITLEADVLVVAGQISGEDGFVEKVQDASESWDIQADEGRPEGIGQPRTYTITHQLSAVGKRFYDGTGGLVKPAWEQARDFVFDQLGLGIDSDRIKASGVLNLPDYIQGFNHVRTENVDKRGGSYSVTETWLAASGTALEEFTVETNKGGDDGLTQVSINGRVEGLEQRDSSLQLTTSKWDNAKTKFTTASGLALTRAQDLSGETLNVKPLSQTIGRNRVTGVINYNFTYDNRPSNTIPSAQSEIISIQDSFALSDSEKAVSLSIPGRAAGPIIQGLNTVEQRERILTVELVMPRESGSLTDRLNSKNPREKHSTEFQKIFDAATPLNNGATNVFVGNPTETWRPNQGQYSLELRYLWN